MKGSAPGRTGAPAKEDRTLAYGELAAGTAAAHRPSGTLTGGSDPSAPRASELGAELSPEALLSLIRASLEDDKAEDIVSIDLSGRSSMADAMVIASGRSTRQVAAIAEKLLDRLKAQAGLSARAEGLETADWVLIDAGDVVVHVFRPEVREFYQLEKLWQPAGDVPPAS